MVLRTILYNLLTSLSLPLLEDVSISNNVSIYPILNNANGGSIDVLKALGV